MGVQSACEYAVLTCQGDRMISRRRYANHTFVLVLIHEIDLFRYDLCCFRVGAQPSAIAQTDRIQFTLIVNVQAMITAQAHTAYRHILLGKTIQKVRMRFGLFILQTQIVIAIIAPNEDLFQRIPAMIKKCFQQIDPEAKNSKYELLFYLRLLVCDIVFWLAAILHRRFQLQIIHFERCSIAKQQQRNVEISVINGTMQCRLTCNIGNGQEINLVFRDMFIESNVRLIADRMNAASTFD